MHEAAHRPQHYARGLPVPAGSLARGAPDWGLGSVNRSMSMLRRSLGQRNFSHVAGFTVIAFGAAGMLAFEGSPPKEGRGFDSYTNALRWTMLLLTTIG